MTKSMNNKTTDDDSFDLLDQTTESALDAFLSEIMGDQAPSDLTDRIIKHLHEDANLHRRGESTDLAIDHHGQLDAVQFAAESLLTDPIRQRRSRRSGRGIQKKNWGIPVGVSAAIAASLIGLLWVFARSSSPPTVALENAANSKQESRSLSPVPPLAGSDALPRPDGAWATPAESSPDSASGRLSTKIEPSILLPSPDQRIMTTDARSANGVGEESIFPEDTSTSTLKDPLADVGLVSVAVDQHMVQYWASVDVQPTEQAPAEEVALRMGEMLGTTVPIEVIDDPMLLEVWLRRPEIAQSVARRWWNRVTFKQFSQLSQQQQALLVAPVAASIEGITNPQASFDEVIASWLSVRSDASVAFLNAMAGAAKKQHSPPLMIQLGALTLSADLRCIRCHDSYIEGGSLQQDYWNFAAILANGIQRRDDGQLTIGDADSSSNERGGQTFFELPDRRQRLAEPSVAQQWSIGNSELAVTDSLPRFAKSMIGAPSLARGIVNSMWSMIHGAPLHGWVVDPMSPPMSDPLSVLEDQLVNDLIASDFDFGRTLTLILTSPTTRRSVPESLRNVWVGDRSKAHQTVIAFAGATPSVRPVPVARKFDQVLRAIGAKFDASKQDLLAQMHPDVTGVAATSQTPGRSQPDGFAWNFPERAEAPPVAWLSTIQGRTQQIEHLGYLAGYDPIPAIVQRSADAMQRANVDEMTMLHRVWWLLQD